MDTRRFVQGFLWGALSALCGGLFMLYGLNMMGLLGFTLIKVPEFQQIMNWTYHNLGLSLLPFTLTLMLFAITLKRLRKRIEQQHSVSDVAQLDSLCDLWTGLFFGIGVIWTAIGMRSALIHALGEPETTAAEGAFNLLRRLVDGGILIALSTTIFGGVGGYLMRVTKTCVVGNQLRQFYSRAADDQDSAVIDQLVAIESQLKQLTGDNGETQTGGIYHESEPMGTN
ncbi:MAG: hypothetical protein V7739_08645 [Motiliproteus sp.]